jgi:hypothetical protein
MSKTSMLKFFSNLNKAKPKPFPVSLHNSKRQNRSALITLTRKTAWKTFSKLFPKTQPTTNLQLPIASMTLQKMQTPQRKTQLRLRIKTETTQCIISSMTFSNKTVWLPNREISSTPTFNNFSQRYPTTKSISLSWSPNTKRSFIQLSLTESKCQKAKEIQLQRLTTSSDKRERVIDSHKNCMKVWSLVKLHYLLSLSRTVKWKMEIMITFYLKKISLKKTTSNHWTLWLKSSYNHRNCRNWKKSWNWPMSIQLSNQSRKLRTSSRILQSSLGHMKLN